MLGLFFARIEQHNLHACARRHEGNPAPIMPAPSTPSFVTGRFSGPFGRRTSLSAAPLLMNSVRDILRDTGSISSETKYLVSISSALSIGSTVPS